MALTLTQLAVRTLKSSLNAAAGVTGDYIRGTDAKEGIVAIRRQPNVEGFDLDPGLLTTEAVDWNFAADDLVLNGVEVEPANNDLWRIQRTDGWLEFYEVLPDATGRCFYRVDDGYLLRVHTKLKKTEPPPQ